jgi:aspartate 1-decarboxylase
MQKIMLKSKIHRATVTGSDLNYEGSIAIDKELCAKADISEFEKVEIYDINNGNRFSTYAIYGNKNEISLNGAAARLVHAGDKIIIACYALFEKEEAEALRPKVVLLDENNIIKEVIHK